MGIGLLGQLINGSVDTLTPIVPSARLARVPALLLELKFFKDVQLQRAFIPDSIAPTLNVLKLLVACQRQFELVDATAALPSTAAAAQAAAAAEPRDASPGGLVADVITSLIRIRNIVPRSPAVAAAVFAVLLIEACGVGASVKSC